MRRIIASRTFLEVPDSLLRSTDPRIKLGMAGLFIYSFATIPDGSGGLYAWLGLLLLGVVLAGRVPLRAMLLRLLPLLPFLLVALFLPFLHSGTTLLKLPYLPAITEEGLHQALKVLSRMITIGATMALLASTTTFDAFTRGMRFFRIPAGIVLTLGLMFRYLFLLADEGRRMAQAHAARGGDWRPSAARRQSLGAMVGVLFIRAHNRGERVYQAMSARGFDQSGNASPLPRPSTREVLGGLAMALAILFLRFRGLNG